MVSIFSSSAAMAGSCGSRSPSSSMPRCSASGVAAASRLPARRLTSTAVLTSFIRPASSLEKSNSRLISSSSRWLLSCTISSRFTACPGKRLALLLQEPLDGREDHRERRAHFVADVGEELRLQPVVFLQLGQRALERHPALGQLPRAPLDLLLQVGVQVANRVVVLLERSHHLVEAAGQDVDLVVAGRQHAAASNLPAPRGAWRPRSSARAKRPSCSTGARTQSPPPRRPT